MNQELTQEEIQIIDGALECLMRAGVDRQTASKILALTEKLKSSGK